MASCKILCNSKTLCHDKTLCSFRQRQIFIQQDLMQQILCNDKTLCSKTSCNLVQLHANLTASSMQLHATLCKPCRRRSLNLNQQPIIIGQQATMSANNGPFQGQTSIRFTPTRSDPNQSSSAPPSPRPHSTIPVPQFPLQLQLIQAMSDCKCSALDSS